MARKAIRWKRQSDPWWPRIYWTTKLGTTSLIVGHEVSPPGDYNWGVLPKGKKETRGSSDSLKEAQTAAIAEAEKRAAAARKKKPKKKRKANPQTAAEKARRRVRKGRGGRVTSEEAARIMRSVMKGT